MRNRANAHQTRENTDLPRPFSDPQQGHSTSKVHHTNFGREPLYAARDEIHDSDKCQRSFPKHPSNSKVTPTTTMFMPWGRYRWTRLPFGISSASEEWQRRIHMVLEGLQVISIADDILVPGCVWWSKNTSQCHTLPGILQRDRTCGPPSGCFKLWFRGHSPTAKHATQWWHLWRFFITTYVIQLQKP